MNLPACGMFTASVLRDEAVLAEASLAATGVGACDCQADPLAMTVPADSP